MSEKVYLVDGSGYIFRAFFAVTALSNSEGFPTNALFGFSRMLLRLLKDVQGGHVVAVFDAGRQNFRHEMYQEYKANRSQCPPDLLKQMPYFREIVRAMGLPVVELPGYEADDVIGTLVERCTAAGAETVIVTGDKDLMQLVSDKVSVWDTMKDKIYRAEQVIEKFGVPPNQVAEVLALIGDSSDNIPGLSGVGPKTATQLILKYGTAENVLASKDSIASDASIRGRAKLVQTIEAEQEIVRLSRKLVELDRKAPVSLTKNGSEVLLEQMSDAELLETLVRRDVDSAALKGLIEKFEFGSIYSDFSFPLAPVIQQVAPRDYTYTTILDPDFDSWLEQFSSVRSFAFDTETSSLDPLSAKLIGASFCWSDTEAFYIPLAHKAGEGQVPLERFFAGVRGALLDSTIEKIGQNLKFDLSVLLTHGVEVEGPMFDTMVASYMLAPDRSSHNLTVLAKEYVQRTVIEYTEVVKGLLDFSEVAIDVATEYGCQDAHLAWLLKEKTRSRLEAEELLKVFSEIDMPLVPILARLERLGLVLDTELLTALSDEFGKKLALMEVGIHELAGGPFNINSPKQLSEILFTKLALPTKGLKRTKTGTSTDSTVLEKLAELHPLPAQILEYRSIHKLKSTYVDALPAQISAVTNRLHTRLNQTVTATSRLSSSDPNLQNIPIQTSEGRRIRETFIADPKSDSVLISADYSQIELRVLAHLSGDENLIQAFKEGVDIHAKTAREIMNIPADGEVPSDLRRIGKTINFGVVYGMGGFRLGRELGIPVSVANQYIENYFARYPKVKQYFARLETDAETKGFVTTLFGRKRFLSQIDVTGRDQGFMKRAAINAPIQGTAADIMKLAMIRIDARIRKERLPLQMLLQIHDELLFEVASKDAAAMSEIVKAEMENVLAMVVPLEVGIGSGKNWQEAH